MKKLTAGTIFACTSFTSTSCTASFFTSIAFAITVWFQHC